MQKIEHKESPSPHVVVENFLSIPAARECLKEAQELESHYIPAGVLGTSNTENDGCEECIAETNTVLTGLRKNKIIFLDSFYGQERYKSKILKHMEVVLKQDAFVQTFQTFPGMFPIISQTTHIETILSSYGKCDFYGWHTDTIPMFPSTRIITCVLHFNTTPQQYQGGELILAGKTLEDQLAYPPVHNTAIFFESKSCVHAVNGTEHEGDFKDSRFSINLWMGFGDISSKETYKYR
jgi:Rps23 Pro-64 3,4-dihydroxylase Tpa1-like proline 4-hydroxylase|tara:strand:- start:889 stop:1599 length:711 start_codon:yes stop_codon:yes gene_type:complete